MLKHRLMKRLNASVRSSRLACALLMGALAASAGACSGTAPDPNAEGQPDGVTAEPEEGAPGRTYNRTVVFMDLESDTTMIVPWDFASRSEPGGVARSINGWIGRGGEWNLFREDQWTTPPSRAPWRILPRGSTRIVMGQEDVLQAISYREGIRDLSVSLGPTLVEWRGQRGEIYRLSEGTAELSGEPSEGLVLDVSTARMNEQTEPLEWALLVAGDRLQVLLADPEGPGPYRAWARRDFQDLAWTNVTVSWDETRSFERARRDVPVLWTFEDESGDLRGSFESLSSHIKALNGDAARLPVLGVYEVSGTVTIEGRDTPVRGFLHHVQH